jgi:hypothetical protein
LPTQTFKDWLQRGVGIPQEAELTVRAFLLDVLGIDPGYVEEKLQTVFLDGRPVDDFDRALVRPGAILALSGAMPGLAGATLRRGGYYARLREGITHGGTEDVGKKGGEGMVVVKLFNRPLADLTGTFASLPLLVPADALEDPDSRVAPGEWIRVAVTLT